MKYRLFPGLFAALLLFFAGCSDNTGNSGPAKLQLTAGLPPVAGIVNAIGGDRVFCSSILPQGKDAHDYEPDIQDIRRLSSGKLFFSTGMTFEKKLEKALQNGKVRVVDAGKGAERIAFDGDHHAHKHAREGENRHEEAETLDPHIWLSLDNAGIIAANVCRELIKADESNADYYHARLTAYSEQLQRLKTRIEVALSPYKGREFYVFHPAFGYFAHMTGLKQTAIEFGGREATAAHLADVIRRAKTQNVHTVFVQPQYNEASARALAEAISGEVVPMDPLSGDLLTNVRSMAESIRAGFEQGKAAKK